MIKYKPPEELDSENLEKMFQDIQTNDLNKIAYKQQYFAGFSGSGRHYYPRSTPPDLLFEEHHDQYQPSFSGSQVYGWNIDGLNEYQIESVMH